MDVSEKLIKSIVSKWGRTNKYMYLNTVKSSVVDAHRLFEKDMLRLGKLLNQAKKAI